MDRLMKGVLSTLVAGSPMRYADILAAHEPVRACKIHNTLTRMRLLEYVEYADGVYYITHLGRQASEQYNV